MSAFFLCVPKDIFFLFYDSEILPALVSLNPILLIEVSKDPFFRADEQLHVFVFFRFEKKNVFTSFLSTCCQQIEILKPGRVQKVIIFIENMKFYLRRNEIS